MFLMKNLTSLTFLRFVTAIKILYLNNKHGGGVVALTAFLPVLFDLGQETAMRANAIQQIFLGCLLTTQEYLKACKFG